MMGQQKGYVMVETMVESTDDTLVNLLAVLKEL